MVFYIYYKVKYKLHLYNVILLLVPIFLTSMSIDLSGNYVTTNTVFNLRPL